MIVTENRYGREYCRLETWHSPFQWIWMIVIAYYGGRFLYLMHQLSQKGVMLAALRKQPALWIMFAALAVMIVLFILRLPFMKERRWAKDHPCAVWRFDSDGIRCDFTRSGAASQGQYSYANVRWVRRHKRYFHIKLDNNASALILNSSFTQGIPDDLEALFVQTLGERYHFQ